VIRPDVTALILAGGRATRFGGIAKHAIAIDGRTILDRQRAVLEPRVAEVIASANRPIDGLPTVADDRGTGPLAGIAAGLARATTPWLLVVAGDMPYLAGEVVDLMLAHATGDAAAVGLRVGGLPGGALIEPLLCVLAVVAARPVLDGLLAAERYKASGLLEALDRVTWIDEAALRAVDPALRTLRNVNSPEDLAR
jgi:molybdopterin-guanine dinucleotide biosynthesis protein A